MDANRRRTDVDGNRWSNFGERQIDGVDPRKIENDVGHSLSQALEKEIVVIATYGDEALTHLSVIDGFREVVREPGVVQIDLNVDIDAQGLRSLPLVLEDSDHADDTKVIDEDVIRHGAHGTVEACLMTLQQHPLLRTRRRKPTVPNESSLTCANSLNAPEVHKGLADCVGHLTGSPRATS